jgi:hypothetical protein
MNEEMQEMIRQYIKDNLSLDVRTDSIHNGGMNSGSCYTEHHTIQLVLDGEIISEVSL